MNKHGHVDCPWLACMAESAAARRFRALGKLVRSLSMTPTEIHGRRLARLDSAAKGGPWATPLLEGVHAHRNIDEIVGAELAGLATRRRVPFTLPAKANTCGADPFHQHPAFQ
jgi:hypothetical protein